MKLQWNVSITQTLLCFAWGVRSGYRGEFFWFIWPLSYRLWFGMVKFDALSQVDVELGETEVGPGTGMFSTPSHMLR